MIDGSLAFTGSANMDIRSFEDNFEVAAIMYDDQITRLLESSFIQFRNSSQEITLEEWNRRSAGNSFKEAFARLISPLF